MILDVLTQLWLELYTQGGSLQTFFIDNDIKNIAIYGGATLGSLFFYEAQKYSLNVNLCIDKAVTEFNNIKTIPPSRLNDNDLKDVELIVVCVASDVRSIFNDISSRVNCNVVTFMEILMVSYYKEVIVPYCNKKNLKPYIVSYPDYPDITNLSSEERILAYNNQPSFIDNPKYFEDIYKFVDEYSNEYIRSVFTQSPVISKGNRMVHSDIRSPYVNIISGIRFTHFTPELYDCSIHLIGHCDTLGFGVDDSRTTASNLQKMLCSYVDGNGQFRVLNHGVWGFSGNDLFRGYETLKNIPSVSGDIVIFMMERQVCYRSYLFDYYKRILNKTHSLYNNLYKEFCEPREMPLMIDTAHLSYYGMQRVAEGIYSLLRTEGILDNYVSKTVFLSEKVSKDRKLFSEDIVSCPEGLVDYINTLLKHKKGDDNIGAVVMNCNPFTKGHRYLIERASAQVDYLYCFVVEEDMSAFPFDERINLVNAGTKDLGNVIVLPSGKYILSAITFPEYFVKDSLKEVSIDPSIDIEIFAKFIAPALNISKRFVGYEPLDLITRQYNQTMKHILPGYGIELIEFERLGIYNKVVSASYVRKLLEESNFEELSDFVPNATLDYLKSRYLLPTNPTA